MEKFAFSFFDLDNDRTRTAQECVYVPEKAFCTRDENGECANSQGCKSGDTLGNFANGCAVGRNGIYDGSEMIAIDRIEGVDWPTADNPRFGTQEDAWTENGPTEQTTVIRICAINIGDGCDNPFSTGHPVSGLCHPGGGAPPGPFGCSGYSCDTKELEAKSVNLNMKGEADQPTVSPALPVPPSDASAAAHPPPLPPAVLRHRELDRKPVHGLQLSIRRRRSGLHHRHDPRRRCGSTLSWFCVYCGSTRLRHSAAEG